MSEARVTPRGAVPVLFTVTLWIALVSRTRTEPNVKAVADSETVGAEACAGPVPVRSSRRGDPNGPLKATASCPVLTLAAPGVNVTLTVQLASLARLAFVQVSFETANSSAFVP